MKFDYFPKIEFDGINLKTVAYCLLFETVSEN